MLLMGAMPALRKPLIATAPAAPQNVRTLFAVREPVTRDSAYSLDYLQVRTLEEACFARVPGEGPYMAEFFRDFGMALYRLEQGRRFKA